ncbi:MAG: hypothetical protein Q9M50_05970 [Methylococcales bacterium]|nr:hypothetical protein [Methylococcales bacterium]
MKKTIASLLFSTALVISFNSFADEVWNSNHGKVIYSEDSGTTALWQYNDNGRDGGIIYIENLAGVYNNRGSYEGYWAQDNGDVPCETERGGVNGRTTTYWGYFHINFIDKDFPSHWKALWGNCEGDLTKEWNGTPVTSVNTPKGDETLDDASEIIRFAKGASSAAYKKNMLKGKSHYYYFTAREGQMLNLDLASQENNATFSIYKPFYRLTEADDVVEVKGEILNGKKSAYQMKHWLGEVPISGQYLIVIEGSRGNVAYNLQIFIK